MPQAWISCHFECNLLWQTSQLDFVTWTTCFTGWAAQLHDMKDILWYIPIICSSSFAYNPLKDEASSSTTRHYKSSYSWFWKCKPPGDGGAIKLGEMYSSIMATATASLLTHLARQFVPYIVPSSTDPYASSTQESQHATQIYNPHRHGVISSFSNCTIHSGLQACKHRMVGVYEGSPRTRAPLTGRISSLNHVTFPCLRYPFRESFYPSLWIEKLPVHERFKFHVPSPIFLARCTRWLRLLRNAESESIPFNTPISANYFFDKYQCGRK